MVFSPSNYAKLNLDLFCNIMLRANEPSITWFTTFQFMLNAKLSEQSIRACLENRLIKIIQIVPYNLYDIYSSVQAEKIKIAATIFLDAWDLRSHMAGHFCQVI